MNYILVEALPFKAGTRSLLKEARFDSVEALLELPIAKIAALPEIDADSLEEIASFKRQVETWRAQGIEVRFNQSLDGQATGDHCSLLHYLFPQIQPGEPVDFFFRDEQGNQVRDRLVDEARISSRLKHSLKACGILGLREIFQLDYRALDDIRKLGEKSKSELLVYLKENTWLQIEK
ncbi:DNA-directed RNA polymerase subunit alpha C-terminal domain-containing protein [Dubosiella muris]|uniref:Uncharacterized protein n=2 Tax=Dubosiella TaxID=1937008 RepID=A0AC61RA93_9FIRM|nr:DNA-directed RNA polymerase subunit alpha C-terminal domain-containing protein [Dubosiella muris]TGY67024.1 hypothetical protein E5336_01015 [Dubosiella muris]